MPLYRAYGLVVDSEIELPELPVSNWTPAALTIKKGRIDFDPLDTDKVICRPISKEHILVHFRRVGTARVTKGREIMFQAAVGADELAIRLFLLQQALAMALLQRGYLVLHAGSVVAKGKGLAFLGGSGQGKSTMVAALGRVGCGILSDDVLAVDMSNPAQPMAQRGLMQLKLTAEARAEVAAEIVAEQTIRDRTNKKLCKIGHSPVIEAAPLTAIFLLADGEQISFERVPPARAVIELVAQSYGVEIAPHIGQAAEHLRQCAAIVREVPIWILKRPRELSLLGKVAEEVLVHIRQSLP